MTHISSYSKVYSIGHKAVLGILKDPVIVQEKIDGSQISWSLTDGVLTIRSKNADIYIDNPPKMFAEGVNAILDRKHLLTDRWIYRAEYLSKPKHNTLAYGRIPKDHIILFDVDRGGNCDYYDPNSVKQIAESLDFECVPTLYSGKIESINELEKLLETESILGGQKIEGVVVKNYSMFTRDKKVAMAKYVNEQFQEEHIKEWGKSNPGRSDIINKIVEEYRVPARWQKSVQHLRDQDLLENEPGDIGKLIKATREDILEECEDEIKDKLFKYFWEREIQRRITHGLPEWYKEKLTEKEFENGV